jgi:cardiolipin synthase A/B
MERVRERGTPPSWTSGQDAALLDGGPAAYPRMLAAIEAAEHDVRLEVYAFAHDEVGGQFIGALGAAARRGVRVAVVLDGWGSIADGWEVTALLRDAGCEVAIYNPLAALLAGHFRRNHRKILLVDDAVAFVGGINIGDAYGRMGEAAAPRWIDLALELRGPVVPWLGTRLRHRRAAAPPGPLRVHLSGLGGGWRLRRRYLKALGGARHSVRIAHAYFLPDQRLVRSITAAARRGVEVTLLLPGVSDVPFARAATRRLYRQLLRAGVRIFEWTETVLHAKVAVTDGRSLLLGSFNLDPFSLANLETLVEVNDAGLAREADAWMDRMLARARSITEREVAAQPRVARWLLDALGLAVLRVAHRIARLLAAR